MIPSAEENYICSLHGNAILPVCGECRRGLEIRRRVMQLEKFDNWLYVHRGRLSLGLALVLGVLVGIGLLYGL